MQNNLKGMGKMDSKKILSIYCAHNSTIGLFGEDEDPLILHEEKFNNIKNYWGIPEKSIRYALNKLNNSPFIIDSFPITSKVILAPVGGERSFIVETSINRFRRYWNYFEYKAGWAHPWIKKIMLEVRNFLLFNVVSPKDKKIFEDYLNKNYSISPAKVKYYDHHTCHCFSPVFFYNLKKEKDKFLLFSMDGSGDGDFAKIFIYDSTCETEKYSLISTSLFDASLGLLYSEATKFLGMKPLEDEYKVMGLAAYVNDFKYYSFLYNELKELVALNNDNLRFEAKINLNISQLFFRERFTGQRFDYIAAAVQKLLEDYVVEWIETAVKQTGIKKIVCSGGVFLNVKMNKKIQESSFIEEVYFMPSCGDESNVFGAAYLDAMQNNITLYTPQHVYLGLEYTNEEVEKFLRSSGYFEKYRIKFINKIEEKVAELLASGKIIANFKGRGEFGARALGNRSILGNPSDIRTFYKVNNMIKMRDFWMPFAPTILEEWADKYIKNWSMLKNKVLDSSRFMITAFDSTYLAREQLIAAIHPKDHTLRPQILNEDANPEYYKLLKYFEKLTGMGGVLNTSLNLHGYPLVGSLEQAMFTFDNSGLEYMAVENFLVIKE